MKKNLANSGHTGLVEYNFASSGKLGEPVTSNKIF
jgi:hypothetical protein